MVTTSCSPIDPYLWNPSQLAVTTYGTLWDSMRAVEGWMWCGMSWVMEGVWNELGDGRGGIDSRTGRPHLSAHLPITPSHLHMSLREAFPSLSLRETLPKFLA